MRSLQIFTIVLSHSKLFFLYHLGYGESYFIIFEKTPIDYPHLILCLLDPKQLPGNYFSLFTLDLHRPCFTAQLNLAYQFWSSIQFTTLSNQTSSDDKVRNPSSTSIFANQLHHQLQNVLKCALIYSNVSFTNHQLNLTSIIDFWYGKWILYPPTHQCWKLLNQIMPHAFGWLAWGYFT